MKAKPFSLALLLLAGAASSAFAQEREWRGGRGNLVTRPAPEAAQAGPAPEARQAPEARGPRGQPPHTAAQIGRPGPRELPSAEGARRDWNRGDSGRRDDGNRNWGQRPADRPDLVRPDNDGRDRRWGDNRNPQQRPGVDNRNPQRPGVEGRGGGDRVRVDRDRDWERDRNDRHGDGRTYRDRNWQVDRAPGDRNRPGPDWRHGGSWQGDRRARPDRLPTWRRGQYPPAYSAHVRHRGHVWRAPPGYYVRSWRYGEHLPVAWYGQSYWIMDWWVYDLPEPPPGYEWVRVGSDAVLVDTFTGEIVQVVRLLFW